ncbi:MAG TPA: phosphate ABC transporter ATP-binding protein, partial [Treponema sp.]|nr:phosphate ABC transporter ATP-binding protein [Treponema sp.]
GLSDKRHARPAELSGGQKQRAGIARALSTNPSILLCDEATSALDPKTTESILELLQKVNRELGVTIVMITHQMEVIRKICTNVAVIDQGRIVEDGTVREVFGNPQMQITKDFVRTIINDTLPRSLLERLSKYPFPQKILRLRFEGGNADDPVISDTVKKFNVNISILFSTVTELQNTILGYQTVQLTGPADETAKAEAYLSERNVGIQEVTV